LGVDLARADAWSDWLARSKTADVDAATGQRFEHFYFLLEAAVAGLGVAVAPRPLVMEDLRLGRLVAPFGFVRSGRQYCLLARRSLPASPKSAPSAPGSTRLGAADRGKKLDRRTGLMDNN
jgi:DNA-binding transcriptional LysR family regulator